MPVNNHENEIAMLKYVHNLQIKNLHIDLASLRSDALRWEMESVYMMHLLMDALQWAKHTNHDRLTRRIATFLEFKGVINPESNTEDKDKEPAGGTGIPV